jgi:putative hydrolase of the HAD superfamily
MKIKSLSFDLWNTLFYDHNVLYDRNKSRIEYFRKALERNGYDHEHDIAGAMKYCWEYFDKIWRDEHRTLSAKDLLLLSCEQLNVSLPENDVEDVSRFYEEIILDYKPNLFIGAKETIPELAKRYKLGITSDTAYTPGRVLRELLEHEGLLEYFTALTFSDEIGCSKPDPRAFGHTVRMLETSPEESIHIGDNEYTDIQGAKKFGMKAILFKGAYERDEAPTAADYRANDWNELKKILMG